MKKTIVLAFLLVAGSVFGQDYTFQGLPWGSFMGDIIVQEGNYDYFSDSLLNINYVSPESRDYTIVYKNRDIAGYSANVGYTFATRTRTLIRSGYSIINISYAHRQEVFNDIINKLTIQYGNRINNLDPLLIAGGWTNVWVSNRTMISVKMYVNDISKDVTISISYFSQGEGPNRFGDL